MARLTLNQVHMELLDALYDGDFKTIIRDGKANDIVPTEYTLPWHPIVYLMGRVMLERRVRQRLGVHYRVDHEDFIDAMTIALYSYEDYE